MLAKIQVVAVATMTLLVCAADVAHSTEVGYSRKYGVGAVVGDPTGLSGKIWVGPTNAIDMGLGFYGYGYRGRCFRDREGRTGCVQPVAPGTQRRAHVRWWRAGVR